MSESKLKRLSATRIKKREPLNDRQKEIVFSLLLRDQTFFQSNVTQLDAERDLAGDANRRFALVWEALKKLFEEFNSMPSYDGLLAELDRRLEKDEDFLDDDEATELARFLRQAYDKRKRHLNALRDEAKEYLKRLLHEGLQTQLLKEVDDGEAEVVSDLPAFLTSMHERAAQIDSINVGAVKDLWDDDDDDQAIVKTSTGCTFLDEYMGGGHADGEVYGLMAPWGVCKCLGRGTPVLKYDGTVVPVETVRAGEDLIGPDSQPRRVLKLYRGREMLYRVTPIKGDPYVVNESHILSLKKSPTKKGEKHKIVNISVREYLQQSRHFQAQHLGWRSGVDFSAKKVPLDPYFLGAWLGNGHCGTTRVTTRDDEVVRELERVAVQHDLEVRFVADCGEAKTYSVVGDDHRAGANPILNQLRTLNVVDDKHVPQVYLANSRHVRLELLAGLLDTDNSMGNNCHQFVSANERLADAVVYLARSLGLAAYKKSRMTGYEVGGKQFPSFYVIISGHVNMIPCRVPRRQAAVRKQKKDVLVTGIKVEPIGVGDFFGFEIDGDHLFLLGDFTVTHNTTLACQLGASRALQLQAVWNEKGRKTKLPIVYMVFYEEQRRSVRVRLEAFAAQIERKILESRQFDKFSSRKLGNYKDYEKSMWGDLISRGVKPPGELERYNAARRQLQRNVRVINFTGDDPAYKLHAGTMTDGILQVIKEDQRNRGNPGVGQVIIDYAGAAAVRHLSANPHKEASREMRHLIGRMPLDVKVNICAAMRTHAWVVNQLSTEANSRSPGTAMKITDGAEARNFPEHCDFAFLIGTKTDDGLAVLTAAKQRREEKKKDCVIRVDGRFCAVRATDNEFLIENNKIVSAKEFSRVADADDEEVEIDDDGDYGSMM